MYCVQIIIVISEIYVLPIWTSQILDFRKYSSPPLQRTLLVPSKSVPTLGVSPHQGDIHSGMGGAAVGGLHLWV